MNKKVLILLPDGIGLRNFAFTKFLDYGKTLDYEVVFWNNTAFDFTEIDNKEIKIHNTKLHPFSNVLKIAKIQIGLNLFIKRTGDKVYDTYRFPFKTDDFKSKIKDIIVKLIIETNNSEKGIQRIEKTINWLERKTSYYNDCVKTLKEEKPAFVFCTNQRQVNAIAPLLAAQDLKIPTATFIFSWDNLPKATMIVNSDTYFVWSDFMKQEMLYYYPNISASQICITGTTQFEPHFDKSILIEREEFFKKYNLNKNKMYICFSGDDITTSPDDEQYLENVAYSVKKLNEKGNAIGIIFRRSPVDFSDRYDAVLHNYKDIIVAIDPLWKQNGETWNTVMPTADDLQLQVNIISHSAFVVNIASSMVFDFAALQKPCFYINYNSKNKKIENWNSQTIYNFVHFRSMPNKECVFWINNPDEIEDCIIKGMGNEAKNVIDNAKKWFEIINQHPPEKASERIWDAIEMILKK